MNIKSINSVLLSAVFLAALAGCATAPVEPEPVEETVQAGPEVASEKKLAESAPEPEEIVYPVAPFTGDTLYNLLAAEVAGYRTEFDFALEKYVAVAEETRDPQVAARATRLALYLKDNEQALRTALVWAEEDPRDADAHRAAVDLLLKQDRMEEAITHLWAIKELGGMARFDLFAYRSANLSPEQRESVLAAISRMLEQHPTDEQLKFARAILLEQTGRYEESLVLADELLLESQDVSLVILKASLLSNLGRIDEAVSVLEAGVEASGGSRRLRLILARMLFEAGDLEAARMQYGQVLEQSPNDGDVLFALALIALDQGQDAEAKRYFERMVRWNRRPGEAHYYLGGIAEREGDSVAALREYRQAGDGYEFIPAQARIGAILVNEGRLPEATEHFDRLRAQRPSRKQQLILLEAQLLAERGMQEEVFDFLDAAVDEDSENIELLYFRAMTGQRFDRLDILEADLRRVIDIDPENADALNALGYTLTDQTDRHEEALVLIEKALSIKPDEAAFIDSMGWVQYRLNNYEEALVHLRRALELFQNDEVAAHLGEVLWVTGEEEEAVRVWQEALELAPDSEILKDVILRLRGEPLGKTIEEVR
ncbi:MAG: tetratricopeptide repeat protein [Pseudomonadales bacterium]|nr:tetratricopeptide repeat protein [Pseudomonadales bacterium]